MSVELLRGVVLMCAIVSAIRSYDAQRNGRFGWAWLMLLASFGCCIAVTQQALF